MAGLIITVAQQKGGSGKTTLAAHLAVAWAVDGRHRVAILDVDPQGSLGEWLERREHRLGANDTGLTFRTASGWGARRESRALSRDHDVVIVDTPPHANMEARNAMELASLVVVPVQPTPADVWATEATLELARKARIVHRIVLNRVPPRARLTEAVIGTICDLSSTLAAARLGNRVAYAESFGIGSTVLETAPKGAAALEMRALADELFEAVGR